MKKKLLITTDCFLPRWDGIARFLYEIISRIKDDFDITVIAPDFEGEKINFSNVKTVYLKPKFKVSDIEIVIPNKKILTQEILKADIIFSQTIGPIGKNSVKIAKKKRKKIIAFVHSIEWELFSKSVGGFFKKLIYDYTKKQAKKHYNKCSLIMAPSLEVLELFNWLKIRSQKEVVHLGTDSEKFTDNSNKKSSKINLKLPADDIIIGYVGRIAREKDILTLYRAFVRLRKENLNVTLLVIGNGIESLKRELDKKRKVIVLPAQNNIIKYYHAMDIFVQPSLTETTSLTVMEAMSCGLPVVSTKVGFIKDYITKGVNGVFFEKQNAYSLYTKLKSLIENDTLREKIGKSARLTVQKNYQWNFTSDKIKEIISNQ